MAKILGLDLGANSVGWCLIDDSLYNSGYNPIIDSGVRVFEAGIENYGTAKEKSKNVERREARLRRRQIQRKTRRLNYLVNSLQKHGFLNDKDKLQQSLIVDDPYQIRTELLDKSLDPHKFARAMYHIAKHRGYKKLETAVALAGDDELSVKSPLVKGKDDKRGMAELDEILSNGQYRTLGEYFHKLNPHEIRIRNRYTRRKYYTNEFELIWEAQKEFNPSLYNDTAKEEIFNALFHQNKLKSQKDKIGKCKFEPKKPRAPKSHPLYQEFRMLQTVNNLKFTKGDRATFKDELTSDERENLINLLNEVSLIDLNKNPDKNKLRKIFEVSEKEFNLNYDKIYGLDTKVKINKAVGKELSEELLNQIYQVMLFKDDNNWFIDYAQKKWGFDKEQSIKLSKVALQKDYGELSLKVISKIIENMREGMKYHDAMEKAKYTHNLYDDKVELKERLGDIPKIANPVVTVALHQLRKVVNTVIDRYQKPDLIHIEIARDLKMSTTKRDDYIKRQKDNEKANDEAREEILKAGIRDNPSRDDIIKYRLWKETSEICPFSGESISLNRLFDGDVDVEHIIPKSKSLDNSFANKTICINRLNHQKGNRTPFDAFNHDNEFWSQMLLRINKYLPFNKRNKFKMSMKAYQESDGNDFISQQLNDTRYISSEATKYLKQICPNIVNVKGQLTATLRRYWNLNHILPEMTIMKDKLELDKGEKSRLDHRHHAIDAITVALTDRSTLQRLTTYKRFLNEEVKKEDVEELIDEFPFPWEGIINDVKESLSNIIVSHKVKRKRSGKLHEETFYGKRQNPNGEENKDDKNQTLYSVRKPIKSLTRKMLGQIADKKIKEMIFHKAAELHLDINKTKELEELLNQEFYHRTKTGDKIPIKKVRIRVPSGNIRQIGEYNKWAEPGNNFAIVIFKNVSTGKTEGNVFTLLDAIREFDKFDKESVIKWLQENIKYEVEFINTLKANELIYHGKSFPDGFDIIDKETYHLINDNVYRVQKLNYGDQKMTFQQHTISQVSFKDSNGVELNPGRLIKMPNTLEFIKLKIDANGYLELVDD